MRRRECIHSFLSDLMIYLAPFWGVPFGAMAHVAVAHSWQRRSWIEAGCFVDSHCQCGWYFLFAGQITRLDSLAARYTAGGPFTQHPPDNVDRHNNRHHQMPWKNRLMSRTRQQQDERALQGPLARIRQLVVTLWRMATSTTSMTSMCQQTSTILTVIENTRSTHSSLTKIFSYAKNV